MRRRVTLQPGVSVSHSDRWKKQYRTSWVKYSWTLWPTRQSKMGNGFLNVTHNPPSGTAARCLSAPAFPVPCCSRVSPFQGSSCLHSTPPPVLCFSNLSSNYRFSQAQWSILPSFSFSPSPGIPPVNYFSLGSSPSPLLCPPQQPKHCLLPHGHLSQCSYSCLGERMFISHFFCNYANINIMYRGDFFFFNLKSRKELATSIWCNPRALEKH